MQLLPMTHSDSRKHCDLLVAPEARRGSTPNYFVATVGNYVTQLQDGDTAPALGQSPLPLEISQPMWTGRTWVDAIRVLPETRQMGLPPHTRRIAGQFLACHLSHCGGAMSPHTWAVHTSHVLNKDAFWSIYPVNPDDPSNGAVVIMKAEDDERPWSSGGEQWSSCTPMFLTIAAPNFDHLASVEETATLPLIITAFMGPWQTFMDLPGQFHWKFLDPPPPTVQVEE